MWEHLKQEQKEKYKTLITNFASLSEAFSQKAEGEDSDDRESYVAPIVNSKFQETVFQKAFHAVGEDIANTLGLNPLVWTQGIKKLLSSRKIHSLGTSC